MTSWLQSLFSSPISNPEIETSNFINYFDAHYSSDHPTFLTGSYRTAVEEAHRQSNFKEYVDRNFLFWVGSITDMEAYSLSIQLKLTSFPFLTIFMCQSRNAVQIADRFNGNITGCESTDEGLLIDRLNMALEAYTAIVSRTVSETESRSAEAVLRQQQDAEYLEAMELDRQAMERDRLNALRAEEERRQREEQEQQQELEHAMALSRELDAKAAIERLKESFPVEPSESEAEVATVRFQLPSSCKPNKIIRRFHGSDSMQVLYDYIAIHFHDQEIPIKNFMLSTNFPKKDIEDRSVSVKDVGLFPRGALFVTDMDA